jgi:hypothetical protein
MVELAIADLEGATTIGGLLAAEAQAASACWGAWARVEVRFGKADRGDSTGRVTARREFRLDQL